MKIHHKPVISNTSPLIGLWGLNLFALFRDLYIEVWIPREEEKEFLSLEETVHREALESAPWIKTIDLTDSESVSFYNKLDSGEVHVFALADEYDARLVIIDEQKARNEAQKIGLTHIGTVGVLLEAKKEGLIGEIKPLLIALQENGMYLGKSIITDALRKASET